MQRGPTKTTGQVNFPRSTQDWFILSFSLSVSLCKITRRDSKVRYFLFFFPPFFFRTGEGNWSVDLNDWNSGFRVVNFYFEFFYFHRPRLLCLMLYGEIVIFSILGFGWTMMAVFEELFIDLRLYGSLWFFSKVLNEIFISFFSCVCSELWIAGIF